MKEWWWETFELKWYTTKGKKNHLTTVANIAIATRTSTDIMSVLITLYIVTPTSPRWAFLRLALARCLDCPPIGFKVYPSWFTDLTKNAMITASTKIICYVYDSLCIALWHDHCRIEPLRSFLMSSTMLCLIPKNLFSNELTFSFSETVALRSKMGLVSPSICKLEWIFKRTEQRKGDRNVLWAVSCHSSFLWQLQRGNREAGGSVFVCLFSIFDWTILAPKNNNTWNWYGTNVTLYSGVFPGGIFFVCMMSFFYNFDGWLWPLFAFQHSFQLVALLNHVCGTRKK